MRRTRTLAGRIALRIRRDRGGTATEYAIMAGFIAAVIVASVTAFGLAVDSLFTLPAGL